MIQSATLDVLEDKQLSQVNALNNPLRIRIYTILNEPMTVTEVADSLGVDRHSLYYPFQILLKADMIEMIDTRKEGRIVEKVYKSKYVELLHCPETEPLEIYQQMTIYALKHSINLFLKSISRNEYTPGGADQEVLKFRSEDFREKMKLIEELTLEFVARMKDLQDEDGDINYSLTIAQFMM